MDSDGLCTARRRSRRRRCYWWRTARTQVICSLYSRPPSLAPDKTFRFRFIYYTYLLYKTTTARSVLIVIVVTTGRRSVSYLSRPSTNKNVLVAIRYALFFFNSLVFVSFIRCVCTGGTRSRGTLARNRCRPRHVL